MTQTRWRSKSLRENLRQVMAELYPERLDESAYILQSEERGDAFFDANDFAAALVCFNEALRQAEQYHSVPDAWKNAMLVKKAYALYCKEAYHEAIDLFKKIRNALSRQENQTLYIPVLTGLSDAYQQLGQYSQALQCYLELEKNNALDPEYRKYIERKMNEVGEHDIDWLAARISALEKNENDKELIYYYDKYVAIKPHDYTAWSNRARTLNCLQRYHEAIESAERAIQLDAKEPHAWQNLATAYAKLRNYAQAKVFYLKAIECRSNYDEAYLNLGRVYWIEKLNNEAIVCFLQALNANPYCQDAELALKKVILNPGRVDFSLMLIKAVEYGSTLGVQLALAHGERNLVFNTKVTDKNVVHLAVKLGKAACLQILLQHCAALCDMTDDYGQTPLHYAAFHGRVNCMRFLLEFKANVNAVDNAGLTVLQQAAFSHTSYSNVSTKNAIACIELLLAHGADLFVKPNNQSVYLLAENGGERFAEVANYILKQMFAVAELYGDPCAAVAAYQQILDDLPDNVMALNNLAAVMLDIKKLGDMKDYIEKSTQAYKIALAEKLEFYTVAGRTFFYNPQLCEKKQSLADNFIRDFKQIKHKNEADDIFQLYLKKDKKLAKEYDKSPAEFSQSLTEMRTEIRRFQK